MNKENIIYQLRNLVNNFDLTSDKKEVLLDYFSRISETRQSEIYFILLKNPSYIERLADFVSREKTAIANNDEESLLKIFAEEIAEVEKII